MNKNNQLELTPYQAIRLLYLLEMSAGVYATKVDEEEYQTEMAEMIGILDEYVTRYRELVKDAHRDFWD